MKTRLHLILALGAALLLAAGCASRGQDGLPVAQPVPAAPAPATTLSPLKQRWSEGRRAQDLALLNRTVDRAKALPTTSSAREPARVWAEAARSAYLADSSDAWADVALQHALELVEARVPVTGDAETALLAWADHVRATRGFRAAQSIYFRREALWEGIEGSPKDDAPRPPDAHPAGASERLRQLQDRLARLYDAVVLPQQSFAFAQAQAALDVALDEQHQRGSAVLVAAWADRVDALATALERTPIDSAALAALLVQPLPGPAAEAGSLRFDLVQQAQAAHPADLSSAALTYDVRAAHAARLEVTLAQARREYAERGYRAARPYLQVAEQLAITLAADAAATPISSP